MEGTAGYWIVLGLLELEWRVLDRNGGYFRVLGEYWGYWIAMEGTAGYWRMSGYAQVPLAVKNYGSGVLDVP